MFVKKMFIFGLIRSSATNSGRAVGAYLDDVLEAAPRLFQNDTDVFQGLFL